MSKPLKNLSPSVLRYQGFDLDALVAAQMRNLETFQEVGAIVVDGLKLLAEREAELFKTHVERTKDSASELMGVRSLEDFVRAETELYRQTLECCAQQLSEISQLSCKCQGDALKKISERCCEVVREFGPKSASAPRQETLMHA